MSAVTFNQALEQLAVKAFRERINDLGKTISAGALPSYEQYKYHCGIIKGLQEAEALLLTALADIQKANRGTET